MPKQNTLRSVIRKQGMTQKSLADSIGMVESTMSKKMCGISEFTWSEVKAICNKLEITDPFRIFK